MLIDEKDARNYWCSEARCTDENTDGSSGNRYRSEVNPFACCIGSKCMKWRYIDTDMRRYGKMAFANTPEDRRGYCALAGAP